MAQNEHAQSTVTINGEQAKQEMTALEKKAENLRKKIAEATAAGDEKAFNKYRKELNATNKEMTLLAREAFDVKKVLDNLSGSSIKDLEKAQRSLWQEMRKGNIKRGSVEWEEYRDNLRRVRTEISNVNAETRAGAVGAEKFAGGFRQMFAGALAGIAALTGIYRKLDEFRKLRMALEDSQANLKAITGMSDSDIDWLTASAKKLSTSVTEAGVRITASSKDIIDGYTVIGSKRPELLQNKEAMAEVTKQALTLAAAGKMDVVEAFEAVTASMNQFNLGADQANRVINILGAGSLEGSAEINDLSGSMKNVGTVAASSNLSLEQSVALLEVLASKQLLGEEAGTKLRGAILKMKEANVGYVSGQFNMRDALVEVNSKLAEKTTAAQKDALMQKVFGTENITAGMILLDNISTYDRLTSAITNTTVAEKQAATNTSTSSAKWEQKKNILNEAGMTLVKKMNPALLSLADAAIKIIQIFTKYPVLAIALVAAIVSVTAAYVANTIAAMANVLWTKLVAQATEFANSKTVTFFKTLLKNPYVAIGIAVAGLLFYLAKLATATTAAQKAQKEYNEQVGIEITKSDQLFNALKKTNAGSDERKTIISKINELYGDYLGYQLSEKSNLNEIETAQKKVNAALREKIAIQIKETAKGKVIADAVSDQTNIADKMTTIMAATEGQDAAEVYTDEIIKLINGSKTVGSAIIKAQNYMKTKLGKNMTPGMEFYPANLAKSIFKMNEDLSAIDLKFDRIIKKTKEPSPVIEENKDGDEKVIDGVLMVYKNKKWTKKPVVTPPLTDEEAKKALQKKLDNVDAKTTTSVNDVKQKYLDKDESVNTEIKYQAKLQEVIIAGLEEKKKLYAKGSKEWAELNEQILDVQIKGQEDKIRLQKESDAKALESFKKSHEAELSLASADDLKARKLLEDQLNDGTITREQYDQKIIDQDAAAALAKLKIAEHYAEDVSNFQFATDDERISTTKAANDAVLAADKDYQDAKKKLTKDGLEEIKDLEQRNNVSEFSRKRNTYKADIELLKQALKDKEISLERYNQDVSVLNRNYAENKAQDVLNIANEAANFSGRLQETEALAVENKYAKQLAAAKGNAEATTALQEKMEAEKKKIKKRYADIDFAISIGQIIANTAVAVMKAAPNIPLQVLTGLTGVAELALAAEQRSAVKNLWTGGFTEPGDKFKPAGIVHAGEFVGNQESVSNATVKRVYKLIDYAQKTNTVARITSDDIATAVGVRRGYSAGGSVTSERRSPRGSIDSTSGVMTDPFLLRVLRSLDYQLSNPIKAEVSLLGSKGLHETEDLFTKMDNNISRI